MIFYVQINYKWPCSIAMLNYQRVFLGESDGESGSQRIAKEVCPELVALCEALGPIVVTAGNDQVRTSNVILG